MQINKRYVSALAFFFLYQSIYSQVINSQLNKLKLHCYVFFPLEPLLKDNSFQSLNPLLLA